MKNCIMWELDLEDCFRRIILYKLEMDQEYGCKVLKLINTMTFLVDGTSIEE